MTVYNQNENKTPNDCTMYSQAQILSSTYKVNIKTTHLQKLIDQAIKVGVLLSGGAVFETIYNWNVRRLSKILGLELEVLKLSIYSNRFKKMIEEGQAFGIGLIHGNDAYLNAISRGEVTKKDIDAISKQGGGFKHNNVYVKGKIQEVYIGTEVDMSFETLVYGVNKGVFWVPARTIIGSDAFSQEVGEILKRMGNDKHYNPVFDEKANWDEKAMAKAQQILWKYQYND